MNVPMRMVCAHRDSRGCGHERRVITVVGEVVLG